MLHELLLALNGWPGDVFQDNKDGILKMRKDVNSPFVHPGEIALIDELLQVGTMYMKLQQFIGWYQLNGVNKEDGRQMQPGLYISALSCGIQELLKKYEDDLAAFELDVIRDSEVTLSNLRAGVEQYRSLFESLDIITKKVQDEFRSSTLVLEILKTEYEQKPHLQQHLKRLIPWVNRTFFKQVTSWIGYGVLSDPFNEFLIQKKSVVPSDADAGNPANTQYCVNYSLVPSYLGVPLMEKILFIGNAVSILQKSDKTKEIALEQQKMFHEKMKKVPVDTFRPEEFNNTIQDLAVSVGKVLHRLVLDDANLKLHLEIMKDFYLTGRGELFHDFLSSLQQTPLSKNTLQAEFRRAFSTSAVRVQVSEEIVQKLELNLLPDKEGTLVDYISKLSIKIKHDWPLHVFFTEDAEYRYNQLLHFLLKVRLLQMQLNNIWVDTRKIFRFPIPGGPADLKNVMSFFINHLQHYLQEDVLENQFAILMNAVNKSDTFEDIRIAHGNFQNDILAQSFQTNKRLNHFVDELLNIGYQFTGLMHKHIKQCETEDVPLNEGTTKEIQDLSAKFKLQVELLLNLFKTLSCNPQQGTYLGQFLLRLDFNSYFSSLIGDLV